MTHENPEQRTPSEDIPHEPSIPQHSIANKPPFDKDLTTDSTSDNDANEKSAREKFKKTSIASLYKHTVPLETVSQREKDASAVGSYGQAKPISENVTEEGSRGRTAGKRALEDEDINTSEHDSGLDSELQSEPPNGHTRKRSRDVRAGEQVKGNGRSYEPRKDPVQEENEDFAGSEKPATSLLSQPGDDVIQMDSGHESKDDSAHSNFEPIPVSSGLGHEPKFEESRLSQGPNFEEKRKVEDEEMKDGNYSPRKKRSRDQMDAVVDREQKIAATDEIRAQRRSEELDRADTLLHKGTASSQIISGHGAVTTSAAGIANEGKTDGEKAEAPKATFGATNMLRPSLGPAVSKSTTKAQDGDHTNIEAVSAPTRSAFASSGFATFASSSNSPFGAVGSSSSPTMPHLSTFAKPSGGGLDTKDSAPKEEGGFSLFSKASSAGFGNSRLSTFASAGSNTGSNFGGAPFGGSFGGGFGGGSKLTSFAAPTGDAKLGSANGSLKPIGSSSNDDEDKDGSGTEDDGDDDGNKNDEASERGEKFQHQDVDTGEDGEDTIFSSRAKLYAFKDNNWKEAGSGVFKLNVIPSKDSEDDHKSSRFIMRAHQTYRVLLNQATCSFGGEPSGRNFAFAVIVDGKPVPHMVKVCPSISPP